MTKREERKVRRKRVARAEMFRKRLASRATAAERALKVAIEQHRLKCEFQSVQLKHGGQRPRFYIADFRLWLPNRDRLIVEVDGSVHVGREEQDARRTEWLARYKRCVVIRFTNERVLTDIHGVMAEILSYDPLPLAVVNRTPVQLARLDVAYRATPCRQCGVVPTETRMVSYVNGSQHRRWWCSGCGIRVGGNPVPSNISPKRLAALAS